MKIRRLQVEWFRGIRELDWRPNGDFVCLIGPADSTKSTILDAIEFALSPRWNLPFDDADFHNADTSRPVQITVTVGELPEELLTAEKFGLEIRGWSSAAGLHDEPEDGDEDVVSIRLRVDAALEPTWVVTNDRNPDGRPISAKDRERLGCTRLGAFLDRHLAWSRGSVLTRFTGEHDGAGGLLAEAGRAARNALQPDRLPENLRSAARRAQQVGAEFGVSPRSGYEPRLDVDAVSVGVGGLALHDGDVPVRMAGFGTRRLLTLGLQREMAKSGGVALIDEIDHGLEPHRVRRLLRVLRDRGDGEAAGRGQVLMTSHSPVVVAELDPEKLQVVRCVSGRTEVLPVPPDVGPQILKASEAVLARKIIVCEGKTELGLCRGLDDWWSADGKSFGYLGVALADGGGAAAPKLAVALARLGYAVAYFGDSDQPLEPDAATMRSQGVGVFVWEGNKASEERLALDLPWPGVVDIVKLASEEWGDGPVHDAVACRLGVTPTDLPADPASWNTVDGGEAAARKAVGHVAKTFRSRKGWFKRVDLAERLAGLVRAHSAAIGETDLGKKLAALKSWVEADG